jgi:hypothetical protein
MQETTKTNQLLEEQNRLLIEQNDLIRAASMQTYMAELRARAIRETPWGCKPPTWAR